VKIDVLRKRETPQSVSGEMWVDGQFECFTLEPARVNPVHEGHPCIPVGVYKVILTPSPRLGYVTPELLDVPGRTAIRIHIANFPRELLGCTAVGDKAVADMVLESKDAFGKLMDLLKTADGITAEYHDPKE
jgi:hypothetical protein